MDEAERKKKQAGALAKLVNDAYESKDEVDVPRVNPEGINYVITPGMDAGQKAKLKAYIEELKRKKEMGE